MNQLKSFVVPFLVLAITTMGCSKGSEGPSSQSAEESNPFIGTWNDIAGNTLTVSLPSRPIASGYDHEVKYSGSPNIDVDEACKLGGALDGSPLLVCDTNDYLTYNVKNSTVTLSMPTEGTDLFYL